MNISWGWRIAILYCSFVVFMLFMVYLSVREDIGLIAEDYYQKDLLYEQEIQKQRNVKQLGQDIIMQYNAPQKQLVFHYPVSTSGTEPVKGTLNFYRPSEQNLDFSASIEPDSANTQTISIDKMKAGLWRVKIDWNIGKTPFYTEHTVFVE